MNTVLKVMVSIILGTIALWFVVWTVAAFGVFAAVIDVTSTPDNAPAVTTSYDEYCGYDSDGIMSADSSPSCPTVPDSDG